MVRSGLKYAINVFKIQGQDVASLCTKIPSIQLQAQLPCQQVLDAIETMQVTFVDTGIENIA